MGDSADRTNDIAIWDEARAASATITNGRLDVNAVTSNSQLASFILIAEDITIGNGKSMLSILNASGSGVIIRLREIKIINSATSAITGIVTDFSGYRFTGHSGGTSLTPQAFDTSDSLNGSVTARTGGTITGESASKLFHYEFSSDEWGPGASDVESIDHIMQVLNPVYQNKADTGLKPLTLRAGEGFHLKQVINSTAGVFDIHMTFTQE